MFLGLNMKLHVLEVKNTKCFDFNICSSSVSSLKFKADPESFLGTLGIRREIALDETPDTRAYTRMHTFNPKKKRELKPERLNASLFDCSKM